MNYILIGWCQMCGQWHWLGTNGYTDLNIAYQDLLLHRYCPHHRSYHITKVVEKDTDIISLPKPE